jgi:two-component system invasion response regulator UvrY
VRLGGKVVRILVADDNPAVRRYLRGVLEQQDGWMVSDEVGNGAEAVQRFETGHHDLIVLDLQMPELNGLETAQRISQTSPHTPILMVTLHMSSQLSIAARKAGIRGACAKTDISAVVDAVSALLRQETYFPN